MILDVPAGGGGGIHEEFLFVLGTMCISGQELLLGSLDEYSVDIPWIFGPAELEIEPLQYRLMLSNVPLDVDLC